MSFFARIRNVLSKLISLLGMSFSKEAIDRALEIATQIAPLVEMAVPYCKLLAQATPTSADDMILALAEQMGRSLSSILNEPDPDIRRGLLQGIVRRAVVNRIEALLRAGEIKIGELVIRVPEDLPADYIDQAVQSAWTFFVKERP